MATRSKPTTKTKITTIIGFDPGVTNFGLSITQFKPDLTFRPVWTGKLQNRVRDNMDNLPEQFALFKEEIIALLTSRPPNAIVIERFMNRGTFSGDQGEYVSMMVALIINYLTQLYPECQVFIVNPGIWKQAFCRARGSNGKRVKGVRTILEQYTDHCLAEPHELDAMLMCHFAASKIFNIKPFSHLSGSAGDLSLVENMEKVATGKKKRKRK